MTTQDPTKKALDRRLENVAWALFLIMIGGIWLVPGNQVPEGTWLIGVGLIMLGLNAARYANGIKMSNFTIGLGILALLIGLGNFAGVDLPIFPILLILIGANIIFKALTRQTVKG
jgi:hypothetical protein